MKQKDKTKLGWIVAILIAVLFLNQMGFLGPKVNIPGLTQQPTPTPPPTTTPTTYTRGIVTTATSAYDSLDIATSRTIGTNVKVYWYAYRGGWVLLGSGTGADINVEERDNNIIYAVASVPSGQAFYVDYGKIMQMNSRVQSVEFKDIDGDNVKEYVFRLNVADIPYASGTGKYSLPSFNVYLFSYDSSASLSNLANVTGVGTSKVTKYLEWYVTLSAEKKALAVSKVVLTVGTGDISRFSLMKLNIPGIGYLDGSNFDQSVLSSEIKWTYTISNQLYGANYVKLPVNSLNKFEFTTTLEVDLETGDDVLLTLTIYYLDNTGSQKSLSDSLYIKAA
ncbi:MAG: hypothetical protein QXF26_09205 [Candidatus Bathyarchaeia archaeon]